MQDIYKDIDEYNDPKAFIEYSNVMQDACNDPKAFNEYSSDMQDEYNTEYSNDMKDVYKDADEKLKILIVFDDMIADIINNKKLNSIVTELFIRGRKLNISLVFITQSYFKVPKDVRLNTTHLSQKFQTKENFNKLH